MRTKSQPAVRPGICHAAPLLRMCVTQRRSSNRAHPVESPHVCLQLSWWSMRWFRSPLDGGTESHVRHARVTTLVTEGDEMTTHSDLAMERALRRARGLQGFYVHLAVYLVMAVVLVVIDRVTSSSGDANFLGLVWAFWPIGGWGLAVILHGLSVAYPLTGGWTQRKAEEFYEEERRRDLVSH